MSRQIKQQQKKDWKIKTKFYIFETYFPMITLNDQGKLSGITNRRSRW